MAKQKRVLVQTSFYVYVDVDSLQTTLEEDTQIMDTCDRIVNSIEDKVDDVERIEMTKIKEANHGELKQRMIFYK
jgi:hypothetical protein